MDDLRESAEDGAGRTLSLETEPVEVDPDKAVAVGVIVTELVLNAMKYAYPDGQGPIRVKLRTGPDGRCDLSVEDDGVGRDAAPTPPRSEKGLGRMIVKAMATKLEAEWRQDEAHSGMRVVVNFDGQPKLRQNAA